MTTVGRYCEGLDRACPVAGLIVISGAYSAALLALAVIAASGLVLFWRAMPETRDLSETLPALAKTTLQAAGE